MGHMVIIKVEATTNVQIIIKPEKEMSIEEIHITDLLTDNT